MIAKLLNDFRNTESDYLKIVKAWKKSRVQGAIGFGFASQWLKTDARVLSQ